MYLNNLSFAGIYYRLLPLALNPLTNIKHIACQRFKLVAGALISYLCIALKQANKPALLKAKKARLQSTANGPYSLRPDR
jgi:hypothetical protein